jgi:cystinosin
MIPQAYINYQRKSTEGWSIENILLDLTGGVLGLYSAQLVLDSWIDNDWRGITGNPGKLCVHQLFLSFIPCLTVPLGSSSLKSGLSFLALAFDLFFITQHYILYRKPSAGGVEEEEEGERRRLLERTESNPV